MDHEYAARHGFDGVDAGRETLARGLESKRHVRRETLRVNRRAIAPIKPNASVKCIQLFFIYLVFICETPLEICKKREVSMRMRAAYARKLQLGMQRSAGTGKKYDGEKTWTKATRFRKYNFTINENSGGRKSKIVMMRIRNNVRVIPLIRL